MTRPSQSAATLSVESPGSRSAAREYIYRFILEQRLGQRIELRWTDRADVRIRVPGASEELIVADRLFALPESAWLTRRSVPEPPLPIRAVPEWLVLDTPLEPIPCLFAASELLHGDLAEQAGQRLRLHLDLFGAAFFMLTRYEEVSSTVTDDHERFPAAASLAAAAGFLERPIVDEYVELLWGCLAKLWPALERQKPEFRLRPSHDVDVPLEYGFRTVPEMLRRLAGGIVVGGRSPLATARAALDYLAVRAGKLERDPAFTFDWIMEQSERCGTKSAFYFLVDDSERAMGRRYDIAHPVMRELLRAIHARGHEIGLHASYRSRGDSRQLAAELARLRRLCSELGIEQSEWGVRHHYLRWKTPESFVALDQAGFAYDATMTYAQRAGFRSGTCFEYSTFDLRAGRSLRLRERPLIVMEGSIIAEGYMGLGRSEAALATMRRLLFACRRVGGDFNCLWHNNLLATPLDKQLYQRLLAASREPLPVTTSEVNS